ncbi:MAG TPA: VOC family protein [Polyangia bacterium]|jgi:catechol 2,3-dioxygenase-like lactoylglutathione lyase family enzyme|nr:VOC family protein [Polyangia bacterium]
MRSQPLIVVRDVEVSSRFYRRLLGCTLGGADERGHHGDGPREYERLYDPRLHHTKWGPDGLILQLHRWEADHHHGHLGDPNLPVGNGVMLWFEVDDFDDAVARARDLGARVILDVHTNPNAQHRELWIADPDGYTVVMASPDGEEAPPAQAVTGPRPTG